VTVPQLLAACAGDEKLPFLIIGAHALSVHGHTRLTDDLDLLVPRKQAGVWRDKMRALGYTPLNVHDNFIQFAAPPGGLDLDLMLVNDETFEKLCRDAVESSIVGVRVRVVSLDHLLALKLFALKQSQPHRVVKDMDDVIQLVLKNGLDIGQEKYRQLFEKYGTAELYERIRYATKRE